LRWFLAFAVFLAGLLPTVASAAPCPAAAVDNASAVGSAISYLRTQQRADGGFEGFTPGTSDDFTTLRAAIALAAAGCADGDMAAAGSGSTPLTYLANRATAYVKDSQSRTFPGRAGQLAVAAAALGGNPRSFGGLDLIAEIEGTYNSTTGVYSSGASSGFSTGAASTINQLWPIAALAAAGRSVPTKATEHLLTLQESDGQGGWGFGFGSDLDTTAQVLWALAASRNTSLADARVAQAAQYLRGKQISSGGWPGFDTTTNPDTTAAVIQGLAAIGVFPSTVRTNGNSGYDGLRGLQRANGAFGDGEGNPLATADAIPGLTTYTFPVVRYRLRVPAATRAASS
jgi:hypothetical protein